MEKSIKSPTTALKPIQNHFFSIKQASCAITAGTSSYEFRSDLNCLSQGILPMNNPKSGSYPINASVSGGARAAMGE
jgi:hypothetical protein